MPMVPATQTLNMINRLIETDQGAAFRVALGSLVPDMEDAFRGGEDGFRSHLGASLIGRKCWRELWLGFRWASKKQFPARIIRLFNRGHLEEARFLAMFKMCGFEMWYKTAEGGQYKFKDVSGHFGSSLDCVVAGLPDIPDGSPAYGEFKTSSEKVFKKVAQNGVQQEKFEHYVQMQVCMFEMKLRYGIYCMVNKNDDDLHMEIIELDEAVAKHHIHNKASSIIFSDKPPPKLNESPGWYDCKFCDQHPVCHGSTVPEINCRTCAHSTPLQGEEGVWSCALQRSEITDKKIREEGCPQHIFNPYMLNGVNWTGGDATTNTIFLVMPNGAKIAHGDSGITSKQLKSYGLNGFQKQQE